MTMLAGVAGQPIVHSLSPLIHNAWIAAAGLDADYRAFGPEDAAGFAALVADGRAGGLRGLNVTAPFKEQALALADEASATARTCGSANLLLFGDGRVRADSTDGAGLMAALAEQASQLNVRGQTVVVLG
ncbi:MAG: shikimate dehydrogenase, partial [Pseudomonadota bacterium]|nr:shikimate dehydrogenase [Pseudomonadota bacterium]